MLTSVIHAFSLSLSTISSVNQTVRTELVASSHAAYRASNLHIDWSVFTQSASVPRDVWIELTVPIDIHSSVESAFAHQSRVLNVTGPPLAVFNSNAVTWVAYTVPVMLRMQATTGVCLDNLRVRSLVPTSADEPVPTCLRSLNWRDLRAGTNKMILIDQFGFAIQRTNFSPSPTTISPSGGPFLRLYDSRVTRTDKLNWLRFTGSLVLAVSVTLLFLTFVLTVSFSIIMAYKNHRTHRRRPPGLPRCLDDSDSRLTENAVPTKYNYSGLPAVDPESNSTPCGESLFLNGTDTYRSGGDVQTEVQVELFRFLTSCNAISFWLT